MKKCTSLHDLKVSVRNMTLSGAFLNNILFEQLINVAIAMRMQLALMVDASASLVLLGMVMSVSEVSAMIF